MDILSHGLWAAALYKGVNKGKKEVFRPALAGWWGVFPDLFAFALPFLWLGKVLATGELSFGAIRHSHSAEGTTAESARITQIAETLYQYSHSIIVFCFVIFITFLVRKYLLKKPGVIWEMGGWLLHILMDIPTHTSSFYPTPFLWPLSSATVSGFAWSAPWFMATNVVLLGGIYGYFFMQKIKSK